MKIDLHKKQRIVIIGAGPTGLGVAHRLYELGVLQSKTQVVILEQAHQAGGLASSYRDQHGFLWDNGGHVVFSHYPYYDRVLDEAVTKWERRSRAAYAFMMGSSGKRKFIPYPVQNSIHVMDDEEQHKSVRGLEEITRHPIPGKPTNFDEWLVRNFGEGLCEVFMRKYNRKVWTVNPSEMNSLWMGERVAVPNVDDIKAKIAAAKLGRQEAKDTKWGPNQFFRYPRYGGTGAIWTGVANRLPQGWFHYNQTVTKIDSERKVLYVHNRDSNQDYSLTYDHLVTTAPLDVFIRMVEDSDPDLEQMRETATKFVYSHTHVVGIGVRGQPPDYLANKSWIYFPDSDSPFYRVTILSNYADDMVPEAGKFWSLMCESAEPKVNNDLDYWKEDNLVEATITALVLYGFINRQDVVSKYHHYLDHGYPVPFLLRENFLELIQQWLKERAIYSRGRFGGWRYEVGNQDHSFMQGVELADFLMMDRVEETYPQPSLVNSFKGCNRSLSCLPPLGPVYELVVARYKEDLGWLREHADHCHVYDKGGHSAVDLSFNMWERLPNVGRESHTYLHHIITNYDHLANVTVFTQGSITDHPTLYYKDIKHYVAETQVNGISFQRTFRLKGWDRIKYFGKFEHAAKVGSLKLCNTTLGDFWKVIFGTDHPKDIKISLGGMFGVSRRRIRSHPKKFYKNIISFLSHHSNPEEGHYMERFWFSIFTF